MVGHPWHLLLEQLRSPAEIARILPPGRAGRPVHAQTVLGWITRGVPLPDGSRLHLEGVRCSSRWYTSLEALARFCQKQTPQSRPDTEHPTPGGDAQEVTAKTTSQEATHAS
jgi:hypothetical protein